ncbi:MAG: hypothetical protein Q8N47_02925, partial [Bryobacterales bacterium]|nr:hypothetical protein [Bryobacterales bacterium]
MRLRPRIFAPRNSACASLNLRLHHHRKNPRKTQENPRKTHGNPRKTHRNPRKTHRLGPLPLHPRSRAPFPPSAILRFHSRFPWILTLKVGFVSLGCPKNLVDTEVMMGLLAARGHELTSRPAEA